ncbi:MAG TPA: hypothetical protein VFK05_21290 [Polyangiaceae bacterium]|nr:hypothetical protein [Polyangiaceae bacterium]
MQPTITSRKSGSGRRAVVDLFECEGGELCPLGLREPPITANVVDGQVVSNLNGQANERVATAVELHAPGNLPDA